MSLEPGIYLNLFPVKISPELLLLVEKSRSEASDVRTIRTRIEENGWRVEVYPEGKMLYGYGVDSEHLLTLGFEPVQKTLSQCPHLVCHLISSSLMEHFQTTGYQIPDPSSAHKVRLRVFDSSPGKICGGRVDLYQGWDLRAFFWPDLENGSHNFGLVVDLTWRLCDSATQVPLSFSKLRQLYGGSSLIEVAQHQGEYIPGTTKINFQVAHQHFQKRILPFVESIGEFPLASGGVARIATKPVWVVIGGDEDA